MDRRKDVSGLRAASQLRTIRVVAHPGRWRRTSRLVCSVKVKRGDCETGRYCERARDKTERVLQSAQVQCPGPEMSASRIWRLPKRCCRCAAIRPGQA